MRLELAERLRCPGAHASTPLIVVAQETRDRVLRRAIVGCAVCGLEARITAGALTFPDGLVVAGAEGAPVADLGRAAAADDARAGVAAPAVVDAAALERLVALLHVDAPGGAVLLAGDYAKFATALEASHDVHVVVLASARETRDNPCDDATDGTPSIPFTDATFRAAAVAAMPPALLGDLPRVVTLGGRIVAVVGTEPPAGARILARDDREWVAEREGSGGGMVTLQRLKTDG
jgi:hypothetical protein